MSNVVRDFIFELFADVKMTREARELRDELLANCQERFDDAVSEGLTEQEALNRIKENLGDLDQLMARLGLGGAEKDNGAEDDPNVELRFPAAGAGAARVKLRAIGCVVERVEGEEILVGFEGRRECFDNVRCALQGGVLIVQQEGGDWLSNLTSLFNLGQTPKVRLGIPARLKLDYEISVLSGGIAANVLLGDAKLSSLSGGIQLDAPAGTAAGRVRIDSKSGRLSLQLNARELQVDALSGAANLQGQFGKAGINSASGGLTISGGAEELRAHCVSGTLRVEGWYGRADLSTVSGGIRAEGKFGRLKVNAASGTVKIACETAPETVDVQVVSGTVTLALPEDIPGFRLNAKVTSGRVHNEFGDSRYGDGGARIGVQAASGSVRIVRR